MQTPLACPFSTLLPPVFALLPLTLFAIHPEANAWPVLVAAKSHTELQGLRRDNLKAFHMISNNKGEEISLQVDELEFDSLLILREPQVETSVRQGLYKPPREDPFKGKINAYHRIVLDDRKFSPSAGEKEETVVAEGARICQHNARVFKIHLKRTGNIAYLADCGTPSSKATDAPVKIDMGKQLLTSDTYRLNWSEKSPLLLNELQIGGAPFLANSFLEVRLNPKYFFSLNFGEDKLVSHVTATYQSPLGVSAELALAVKAAGIQTPLQIISDMSGYNDAFYVPFLLNLPFSSEAFKPPSGVFYGFDYPNDPHKDVESDMSFYGANGEGGRTLLLRAGKHWVSMGIRGRGSVPPTAKRLSDKELKAAGFPRGNIGFFVDFTRMPGKRLEFDIWFYAGEERDKSLLRDYAREGIRYTLTEL